MTSQANAYKNLVSAPASGVECGGTGTRVTPGSTDTSILFQKLNPGTVSPCGGKMPLNGPPLTAPEMAKITSWIKSGAPNN
jgi:hypothetical protein